MRHWLGPFVFASLFRAGYHAAISHLIMVRRLLRMLNLAAPGKMRLLADSGGHVLLIFEIQQPPVGGCRDGL